MSRKKSNVDLWLSKITPEQKRALDNAAKIFGEDDLYNVHTLESLYGQESSFGRYMRHRGMDGAAGHFHQEKETALGMGLSVTKTNDQRFNVNLAAKVEARIVKELDGIFKEGKNLGHGITAIPVKNDLERKDFVIAAVNGGQGRNTKDRRHICIER